MAITMDPELGPVAVVSCLWIFMAYVFMPMGPTASMGGGSDAHKKWGDRTFMNMNEQAVFFFVSMWLFALFVDPVQAKNLGIAYLVLRFLYPVIWATMSDPAKPGPPMPQLFISTFPQYGIILYEAISVVVKVNGGDMRSMLMGWDTIGVVISSIAMLMFAVGLTMNILTPLYAKAFFPKNEGYTDLSQEATGDTKP
mmetsp:Transcript_57559/g.105889  ORF Transcript_57559/g.105889 Transcript_57559/m.105889 type:complete len:197 (+) Transcript_57559:63-653(+)